MERHSSFERSAAGRRLSGAARIRLTHAVDVRLPNGAIPLTGAATEEDHLRVVTVFGTGVPVPQLDLKNGPARTGQIHRWGIRVLRNGPPYLYPLVGSTIEMNHHPVEAYGSGFHAEADGFAFTWRRRQHDLIVVHAWIDQYLAEISPVGLLLSGSGKRKREARKQEAPHTLHAA